MQCTFNTASAYLVVAAFPSVPLLTYLGIHATEGWQLLVVAAFLAGFLAAWRWRSKALLIVDYALTCSLAAWVVWLNH